MFIDEKYVLMKYIALVFFGFTLTFVACKRNSGQPDTVVDIFNKAQVSSLISLNKERQKEAISLLDKGNRKFRLEKNAVSAIDMYTSSIMAYPTAKAYFELGNACATDKKYDKALLCYTMAEQLGFQPLSKLLYNQACAYSMSKHSNSAYECLEYAIEAGFLNKNQIAKDQDLDWMRGSRFQEVFMDAMQGVENAENIVWESFMQSFNALVLPVAIDIAPVGNFQYDNGLSYEYEKYVSEMHDRVRFSRGTGNMFYPYGTVEQNNKYIAVIYVETTEDEMDDDGSGGCAYFMASYDLKGVIIDKMLIGGRTNIANPVKTFNMNGNLTFEVKEFEQERKYPVKDSGYYENEIVKTTLKSGRNYKITDEGKFIETGPTLGAQLDMHATDGKKS